MSGDMNDTFGLLSDEAGIIPRVLHSLFNKLEMADTESFVKCSFIELYNEELRDLISSEENKLKIFDDTSRKNHATTVVQGMEECHINTAAEGIKILQNGSLKRQVAATKCNDLSSRSHTIFTVTACVKKPGEDGEEYVCAGKLNLVDLAGSENIQRSGAENKRAAEAGLINKSLLTLGRVINALVDRSSHIPYRESKLTRLLQDSLGGRTKTCIIATISPAKSNLEETISTLDYAFRAKNIRNKPQLNQLINKKTMLREFTHEIERLKSELIATRQRNGVYLSNETYEEMTVQSESRRIQNEEQTAKIETLESNLRNKVQELFSLTSNFMGIKKDHEATKVQLDETKGVLDQTELVLEATRKSLAEETHLRQAHERTEEQMRAVGGELIKTLKKTVNHVGGLHAKNKRKSDLQSLNRGNWRMAQNQVSDVTSLVESRIEEFQEEQQEQIATISERMQSFVQGELQKLSSTQTFLDQNLDAFTRSRMELMEQKNKSKEEMDEVLEEIKEVRDGIKDRVGESLQAIAASAEMIAADVLSELNTFHNQLHTSYSSLGKDCKSMFDELTRHIASQKEESDNLRRQLQSASEAIVNSNASVSTNLQEVINEERRQAAEERKNLLAQFASLINSQADLQESRLANKTAAIQHSLQENSTSFEGSVAQYSQGMEHWNEKEDQLLDRVNVSRDNMKTKLKDDWAAANQHSTSIQGTTRSVHAETVRVVDEQMKDLHQKMTSLDDFVARARSQNAQHHESHAASLQSLSGTVEGSYASIGHHFRTTCTRVQDLGAQMAQDTGAARGALEPLPEHLCRPLANLRDDIAATVLQEYQATGDTPRKVDYQFPTELPRTQPHERLVAKFHGMPSPTKRHTTAAASTAVFADADPTLKENRSPSRPYSSDYALPGADGDHRDPHNPLSMSLREVNPNVHATNTTTTTTTHNAALSLDPRANATIHGFSNSSSSHHLLGGSGGPTSAPAAAGAGSSGLSTASTDGGDLTLPLFKKSRTTASRAAKGGRRVTSSTAAEGRENIPLFASVVPGAGPEVFSQSISRRKSPRLN
ncbi:Kinesin-related motor protein [Diatrype stigma]|uniref:Kinesin-related motor protein n=1 Tax=Diatrype stigma TaxID=117547 RepID=A0AAN9YS49_9PEZI